MQSISDSLPSVKCFLLQSTEMTRLEEVCCIFQAWGEIEDLFEHVEDGDKSLGLCCFINAFVFKYLE